jgi:hypothetical protein
VLPAPPLDVYLQYQMFLLTAEEQEANNATEVSTERGLLATKSQQPPPPTVTPDRDRPQVSLNYVLRYPQDYVASFIGWLLDT